MTEEKNDNYTVEFNEKRRDPSDNNWAVGIALIILGGLFMLDSFNILNIHLHNWWAIFILIPGLSMTARGWRTYRETTTLDSSGLWGLAMIVFAVALFFDISWNLIFPLGLVAVGVYMLFFRN